MTREMKDSGVAWLGTIPANWDFSRVKHYYTTHKSIVGESADEYERLALTLNGVIKRSKEDNTGLQPDAFNGYQVLRQSEFVFKLIDLENVSTSRVGLSPYTGIVSPAYIVLKPNGVVNSQFGYYYFISLWQREIFNHLGDDGVRSSLNANDLLNLPYLFPSFDEQNQIVAHLDRKCSKIDSILDKTRTSIEEYKKLKQAIITRAVTSGIRGDRPMKESGIVWLSAIPADWSISKIKHTIFPHEKPVLSTDDVITCFRDGMVTLRKNRREEGFTISFTEHGYHGVDVGDLVIHGMDTFAGAVGCSDSRGKTSPVVHVCSTIGNNRYFMYFLRYMAYSNVLMDFSNGVRIRSSDFRNFNKLGVFEILIPSLEEQNEIVDYLDKSVLKIERIIEKKERFLAELESYKKSLIYEYVTGKKETPQPQPESTITFVDARALLLCRIIELLKPKGRIHLMKALFTVDCLLNLNSETQYQRQKHGPYDAQIEEYERIMEEKRWINVKKGKSVDYILTQDFETFRNRYEAHYGNVDEEIQRICAFLRPMKTSHAERVATLLAVWNDFIIDGITPTDSQIVQEVRSNWTPNKAHSSESTWLGTLSEMKAHQIMPFGYGKHTAHMQDSEV